ncbi:hypothetical protein SLT67_20865 [Paenibacillus illinoisensis]|uniref:GNAT family N-acetyltransferase n=1 Tax=Paenibacillus illinoisensis TaxID=59845 RepID=UPI003CEB6F20
MNIEVILTTEDQAYIIKNMYPLYLHDLSGHYGLEADHTPNQHGIFENSNHYQTLQDQYDVQNIWWEKPGSLYPFLIMADEVPAGFVLVGTSPYCSKDVDFFVHEFFLMQPYRGRGIAEYAASNVFDKFKGDWELFTNPSEKNRTGQQFWRKTLSNYTKGKYEELYGQTTDGYKLIFRFSNR